MKKFLSLSLGFFLLVAAPAVWAQKVQIGGHVGAVGLSGGSGSSSTKIGGGANLTVNPYGMAALRLDATFASFEAFTYFSASPAIVIYPIQYEEFSIGILGGPGFYHLPDEDTGKIETKFGLNVGVIGDFTVAPWMTVGMEARFHPVFGGKDVWTVFMTAAYQFETGWDW